MDKIRISAAVAAAVVVLLIVVVWWALREPDHITVASWGADYGRAQSVAMINPYTDDSGVQVTQALYGGGTAEVQRQVESGRLDWDVVDFELPDAEEACRRGWLETIDASAVPPAGNDTATPASDDFVPGAIGPCWVASVAYSQIIAFDPSKFTGAAPTRARDFFDLTAFPGGRGMKDGPKGNLELALLATGVAPKDIYALLASPEGVARAFAKLDTIRSAVVWWRSANEPLTMLTDGRAAMTISLNGPIGDAILKQHRNLKIIWDGERYEFDVFAIPRGTLNKDNALAFIRFATGTKPLAQISGLLPYGPARKSALLLHTDNPTSRFENPLYLDPAWWAVHGPAIEARWREWRSR